MRRRVEDLIGPENLRIVPSKHNGRANGHGNGRRNAGRWAADAK